MRPIKTKCCLLLFLILIGGIAVFAMRNKCPDEETPCEGQREQVGFSHELHMGLYDCLECHHDYDAEKNNVLDPMELYQGNPDIKCRSCHGPETVIDPMMAFHRQCMGCHNREASAGRASGPNMCSGCHRQEAMAPSKYDMIIGD